MAANKAELARILAEEYGIKTIRELDTAIAAIGPLDISPFCAKTKSKEKAL